MLTKFPIFFFQSMEIIQSGQNGELVTWLAVLEDVKDQEHVQILHQLMEVWRVSTNNLETQLKLNSVRNQIVKVCRISFPDNIISKSFPFLRK